MRTVVRGLAVGFASIFCMGQAEPEARIDYALRPVLEDGVLRAVEIDLRFRGESDGETGLRLPQSWGGQDELWRSIAALEVVSGAQMRAGEGPSERVLAHRPNARVHVRYRIVQDWEGAPRAELGNTYRPMVQPGYFHLIGNAARQRAVATHDRGDAVTAKRSE